MNLNYPPIPDHPEVDLVDQKYWKMTREEYCILFDVVKQIAKDKPLEILEMGAGEGSSAAVMLLANAEASLVSIDIKPKEEGAKAVLELADKGFLSLKAGSWQRYFFWNQTTEYHRTESNIELQFDLILVDANHEHEHASADINWAVKHGSVVLAHDICHKGTEHIDEICRTAATKSGKHYRAICVGHGFGIIY